MKPRTLRLPERYRPLRQIGQGGMGAVFECEDRRLERTVAIKLAHVDEDAKGRRRFLREAEILANLDHPNILKVLDFGECPDGHFLVLELLEGMPLNQLPEDEDPIPVLLDAAAGLDEMHRQGLVHRDVKPANIFRTRAGRGVLIDFGLVHDPDRSRITSTGNVVGTPCFMAPEVLTGARTAPAQDWYAWAVCLYAHYERRTPFTLVEAIQVAHHGDEAVLRFDRLEPTSAVAQLLTAMLASDPEARPQGRDTMLLALRPGKGRSPLDPIESLEFPTPKVALPTPLAGSAPASARTGAGSKGATSAPSGASASGPAGPGGNLRRNAMLAIFGLVALGAAGLALRTRPSTPASPGPRHHTLSQAPYAGPVRAATPDAATEAVVVETAGGVFRVADGADPVRWANAGHRLVASSPVGGALLLEGSDLFLHDPELGTAPRAAPPAEYAVGNRDGVVWVQDTQGMLHRLVDGAASEALGAAPPGLRLAALSAAEASAWVGDAGQVEVRRREGLGQVTKRGKLPAAGGPVQVGFSPGGEQVAFVRGGHLVLFDLTRDEAGLEVRLRHEPRTLALLPASGGPLLVLAGFDGELSLWSPRDGERARFRLFAGPAQRSVEARTIRVEALVPSQDDAALIALGEAAGSPGRLEVRRLDMDELLAAAAQGRAPRFGG